jgi:hypothetical protein
MASTVSSAADRVPPRAGLAFARGLAFGHGLAFGCGPAFGHGLAFGRGRALLGMGRSPAFC